MVALLVAIRVNPVSSPEGSYQTWRTTYVDRLIEAKRDIPPSCTKTTLLKDLHSVFEVRHYPRLEWLHQRWEPP